MLQSISGNIDNLHFSNLRFHNNHNIDKSNSCRNLILDIIFVGHKNKLLLNSHDIKKCKTVNTQTEFDFFRD